MVIREGTVELAKKEDGRRKFNFYHSVVRTIVFESIYMYSGTKLHVDSELKSVCRMSY